MKTKPLCPMSWNPLRTVALALFVVVLGGGSGCLLQASPLSEVVPHVLTAMWVLLGASVLIRSGHRRRTRALQEAHLRDQESLFDHLEDCILLVDPEQRIVQVNASGCSQLGYTKSELLALKTTHIFPKATVARLARLELEPDDGAKPVFETAVVRKNSTTYPARISACGLAWQGRRLALYTLRDISQPKQAEVESQRNQSHLRAVFESAGAAISLIDLEGRLVESNRKWLEMIGCEAKELDRREYLNHVHPDDRGLVKGQMLALRRMAIPGFVQEARFAHKTGRIVWGLLSVTSIRDGRGKVEGLLAVVVDITVQKRAEEAIRASQAHLKVLYESAGVGIATADATGRFLDANSRWCGFLGYERDELLALSCLDATHPDDRVAVQGRMSDLLTAKVDSFFLEKRFLRKDGQIVWGLLSVTPIRDDMGQIKEIIGVVIDITARKLAEHKLIENEKFMRTVADGMPGLVSYWRPDLRCSFANVKFAEWFGRTPQEMQGLQLEAIMGHERSQQIKPYLEQVRQGVAVSYERAITKEDGTLGYWWARYIPDIVDGELRGAFVLVTDITGLKQAQQQLEALNVELRGRTRQAEAASLAKSDFLANMSHEIRTPMNAIMGLCHLAMRTELSVKQREYLGGIQDASRSLLALINDILDLSKIESDKVEIERAPFDLKEMLDQSLKMVTERAREKGLTLSLRVEASVPRSVVGDSMRLGQVLLNLVSNAVKFTEHGQVVVATRVLQRFSNRAEFLFEVTDTGIGIATDTLLRLFETFTQADSSTTRRYGGTGLGLAISKRLVELMHGQITVQSRPGQGSTFSFSLPLGLQSASCSAPAALFPDGLRALVVDDDPRAREIMSEILSESGLAVDVASTGAGAIEMLVRSQRRGSAFDFVLLDWRMPEMDGFETARRIREDPRLVDRPSVVLVTGYGRADLQQRAADLRLDGVLLKPVDPEAVRRVLASALDSRRKTAVRTQEDRIACGNLVEVTGGKVLLAEDNEMNRLVALEILGSGGFQVDCACDGREAVDKALAADADYDVVLMDVQMPVMDGIVATTRIRQVNTELPILAMTADALDGERQRCLEAGMNDHLAKPFEPEELLRVIAAWIGFYRKAQFRESGATVRMSTLQDAAGTDQVAHHSLTSGPMQRSSGTRVE